MKQLYNTPEKRTITRLFLWFLLIAGNMHFYYCQQVQWAIESPSRIETMVFVAFLDICMFASLLLWQEWDGFERGIVLRFLSSFALAIFGYMIFYPAFYNSVHATTELKEIYTLFGHPVVLVQVGIMESIAVFWTFMGMSPVRAWDVWHGREKQSRVVNSIHSVSNSMKMWAESKMGRRLTRVPEPEKEKVLMMNQTS